jgi:isopenicillin N synthase-like dioxygenase
MPSGESQPIIKIEQVSKSFGNFQALNNVSLEANLLSRWTDGVYKSTPHRVVNSAGRNRLSQVFAFDSNPETVIDPRQIFGNNYPVKHKPITCGDYLEWRFNKAFSYRRS